MGTVRAQTAAARLLLARLLMHTQDTIRTLNRLIRTCRDGEAFCRVCARCRVGNELQTLLRSRSEEWARQGDELQALVLLLNGEPALSGTFAATMRRGWIALRAGLIGSAEDPVVEAWELMQREAWERYAAAMSGYLPERIRRTISLQSDRISDRCDQIGSLRLRPARLAAGAPRTV
jgi:uncharacterized protein (TIGR02284 family)